MSKFIGLQAFFEILMITLVFSPKQHPPKHMQHSVSTTKYLHEPMLLYHHSILQLTNAYPQHDEV